MKKKITISALVLSMAVSLLIKSCFGMENISSNNFSRNDDFKVNSQNRINTIMPSGNACNSTILSDEPKEKLLIPDLCELRVYSTDNYGAESELRRSVLKTLNFALKHGLEAATAETILSHYLKMTNETSLANAYGIIGIARGNGLTYTTRDGTVVVRVHEQNSDETPGALLQMYGDIVITVEPYTYDRVYSVILIPDNTALDARQDSALEDWFVRVISDHLVVWGCMRLPAGTLGGLVNNSAVNDLINQYSELSDD